MRGKQYRELEARLARIERTVDKLAAEYLAPKRVRAVEPKTSSARWVESKSPQDDWPEFEAVETIPAMFERIRLVNDDGTLVFDVRQVQP